jgi:hypothetical protein
MMLRALRTVSLTVVLAFWPAHPSHLQLSEDVEPHIKGGQSIAREGRWSIFRMGDAPTRSKCLALHRSRVRAILFTEGLQVEYLGRGPVIAYSLQADDRALGPPQSPWVDPWIIGLRASEFRRVVGAKRLRIDAATQNGRILDDLDLTGIQAAVEILASDRCK